MSTNTTAPPALHSTAKSIPEEDHSIWASARFKLESTVRNFTRAYLNTYAFFEADLTRMVVSMPATELRPRLFSGVAAMRDVSRFLVPLGARQEDIEERICRGDLVSIGFVGDEPAGYVWMTFQTAHVKELGLQFDLEPSEAVQYDTFVATKWRGRGFQYPLNVPVLAYAREHGINKTLAWVHVLNTRSFKNQVRSGKRVVQKVVSLRLPGMEPRAYCLPGELKSRFTRIR